MPYLVSDEYKTRIKQSHSKKTIVRILTPYGFAGENLVVTQGGISDDQTNAVQGQCDITFVDESGTLVPEDINDLLYPGVNEVYIEQSVVFPSGTTETIAMGIYNYEEVQVHDTGDSFDMKLSGFDRSKKIADAGFLDLYVVPGGTNVTTAIQQIILSRRPNTLFRFTDTSYTVNQITFDRGSDPWAAAKQLANSAGMRLYFDRQGFCVLEPQPISTSSPHWEYREGHEATTIELTKTLTQAQYNRWIEIAEGGDIVTPFRAEALDEWSINATGDRPTFHVSSLYTHVDQCQAAANAERERKRGTVEGITIQTVPNPAVLSNDVMLIENSNAKINSVYVIDRVSTPLTITQGQYLTARKQLYGA